jgi:hypothetical protein
MFASGQRLAALFEMEPIGGNDMHNLDGIIGQ